MTNPAPMWLPLGFQEWMPVAQAATLALLTLLQEDVPTVSAALLASAGSLTWKAGFLGCFLGIWGGDALLYLLARGVGRPLMQQAWTRKFFVSRRAFFAYRSRDFSRLPERRWRSGPSAYSCSRTKLARRC